MAAQTRFGLLGPLLVDRGGRAVAIPAGKQRVLLAALLLNANRVVSLPELAEALWASSPPASARVTIHNYVKRLRQALDGDGDARIATLPGGYLIRVDASELDVSRFEAAQEAARDAARQGDWATTAEQLHAALSLWRGEPLVDVVSEMLALQAVPRLEEMRLHAAEACIDAELRLGRHAEVIAELRQLAGTHPLRERLYALLMLALYRDGQQGEALATYQRARRVLIDELGTEPGPELRHLEQQVLEADPALELPAAETDTTGDRAGLRPSRPAPAVVPRQLPAPVRHFVGRADELKLLTSLLDPARAEEPETMVISAIGGTAGVGKTALALRWAHQVADRFPDGQLYVNLRGFDPSAAPVTPADAIRRFLTALREPGDPVPADDEASAALYRSLLAGRRMLIVLDNARDAGQVRPLLPGSPGCLVLVTSRSQLASLIAVEGAHPVALDVLTESDANELLARRIGAERTAAEPVAAAELIGACARLPLALAIATARAELQPGLSLAALAGELRDARGPLDALNAGDAASSVQTAFSWSYQQLSQPAARMFRLLGLHPGPDITAAAAASLAGLDIGRAGGALRELIRASLLAEDTPGRFGFHDLLRAYAAELADSQDNPDQRQSAIHRMLDHYLHTADTASLVIHPRREEMTVAPPLPGVRPEDVTGYQQAMAWLEAEHRVLLAVLRQAADVGLDTYAWQLPTTLRMFLYRRGYWDSMLAAHQAGLEAGLRLGDLKAQASAHQGLATARRLLGHNEEAHTHLVRALELSLQAGDLPSEARAHDGLAALFGRQGRYRESLDNSLEALRAYQAVGNPGWLAFSLNNVGYFHALLGNYTDALGYCEHALTVQHELGDWAGQAHTLDSLGVSHQHLGHYADAVDCYSRALALAREIGDRYVQAAVLSHLGDAHDAGGNPRAAREAWQQALEIFNDLNDPSAGELRGKLAGDAS
jgi:DNA-binding SARP family transcriptional activator